MSRVEFRAAVTAPRPAAAWVMVGVAGATLWITRQLAPWAIVAQAGALLLSLALRRRPHAWQRSPLALNLGMLGVTSATIAVALRGQPSVVALAHFAALGQGLQLLDARPRRSEFLLVVLALFQVTLAANLTDSVFFIPLLAAFVVSTTWTLMVHTLRTEALEAGTPHAVTKAITPGLLRATFLVSGAAFALALALFLLLPRMRASLVEGGGLGPMFATAGFSDHVRLGDLGRIRRDPTVVMRVETLEGQPPRPQSAYWRGLAFDRFDGRTWSIRPARRERVPGVAEVGVTLGAGGGKPDRVERIVREPVASGVIFASGDARRLQGTIRRLERDANGGLYAPAQSRERVRYTVASAGKPGPAAAASDDAARVRGHEGERYLALPPFRPELAELAARITAGASSDAARALAIETHLRRSGRYSDVPPSLDSSAGHSSVEAFLFGETAGHCEYFATAMVVLARSLGLPARLVNGFAGGRENRIGGFVELARSDAHAWVEIHFERAGWVRYDPTPPDRRLRAGMPASLLERLRELGSAVELWWFQRVIDFDRSDQLRAMRSAWLAWRGMRDPRRPAAGWRPARWQGLPEPDPRAWIAALGALAAALLLARRLRRPASRDAVAQAYARALRLLVRRGLRRAPAATARDFARRVRAELPGEVAAAFEALTESHLRERFGGRPSSEGQAQLSRLRAALRQRPPLARRPSRDGCAPAE